MKILPLALLLTAATVHAATITPTVTSSPGTSYTTAALTGYTTTAADMVGSAVTVSVANGTTGSATWTATGAFGTGWSLVESGDTFTSPWTLTNSATSAIIGFTFDGVPGNTTFDIVTTPEDTPGSGSGNPFSFVTGPAGLTVAALYTNQLIVGGTFYGDEYTKLIATLGGTGLTSGQTLSYESDTDNATASSGIVVAVSPEPSSFILLGSGLLGLGAAARRRFNVA